VALFIEVIYENIVLAFMRAGKLVGPFLLNNV